MSRQSPNRDSTPDEPADAWDAHDPRRQNDQFAPPTEPCECICHHCGRTFMSDQIWLQKINGARDGFDGFWMCPTPNCGGAGFTFDIFPTDPNHPARGDWVTWDDDGNSEKPWSEEDDSDDAEAIFDFQEDDPDAEYDPDEPAYQMLDQWLTDDEDLEGEEWKYGLAPGERPEPEKPDWLIEEEKKYDEPDRRPREVDWTEAERQERHGGFKDDDIPF